MKEQSSGKESKEIDALKMEENEIQKKIDGLNNLKSRKNLKKIILIQKLKYSTNPTLNERFYSQFEEGNNHKFINNETEELGEVAEIDEAAETGSPEETGTDA